MVLFQMSFKLLIILLRQNFKNILGCKVMAKIQIIYHYKNPKSSRQKKMWAPKKLLSNIVFNKNLKI